MKKLFVSAILAVSALTASAQLQEAGTFAIEPHVGVGYTTLSNFYCTTYYGGITTTEKISGGLSYEIGADAIYKFTDKFGVSAGLSFFGLTSDEVNKCKFEMNTLDIPVLAHYNFTPNFGAFAGFKFAFKMSYKNNDDGDKTDIKGFNSTRVMLPIGLKYTFNSNWSLSAQYNFSLTRLNENEVKGMDNIHVSPIMLNLGYRFDL